MKVVTVFGTRPEAIKMCPLVKVLEKTKLIESIVCITGQHRQMLDQMLQIFHVTPDYDLNVMKTNQTLTSLTANILLNMEAVLDKEEPDLVLVHGDTTTSFVVALAAFYKQIPVGHVEAGLRSFDKYSPFPEEMNRCLTARIAELHFAPTKLNASNLRKEGIKKNIFVTGNTVIDAFQMTIQPDYHYEQEEIELVLQRAKRTILVTAHRRENLGEPLEQICRAILRIVKEQNDVEVIYPVHLNPKVRKTVFEQLNHEDRIHLIDPVDVLDMHNMMSHCYLIMTDSGGIQEEASSLGIPTVLLRKETERTEAIQAGIVILAGVEEQSIYEITTNLLTNSEDYHSMAKRTSIYGDGTSSQQIVDEILRWKGIKAEK